MEYKFIHDFFSSPLHLKNALSIPHALGGLKPVHHELYLLTNWFLQEWLGMCRPYIAYHAVKNNQFLQSRTAKTQCWYCYYTLLNLRTM